MTTITIKQLANGQLASSEGTLYTTPAVTQTIIKSITVVNTDSVTRTFTLYQKTTTSRAITPVSVSLLTGEMYLLDQVITLAAGDLIRGIASAATVLDYVISGVEEA